MVLLSIALLPIYLALRWPFFRLPLHMDTGFYVSNHTICARKLRFSKGWNATYAGCSKVVPEFFYSLVYLLHGGGDNYKFYSRFYYSFYCFAVATLVGLLAYALIEDGSLPYFIGLILFCLLSSEPHYGIYFESGEQFELLPQVLGFLWIYLGLDWNSPLLVGGGVGLWVLESYFIKLSSLPGAIILGMGAGYFSPSSIPYSVLFSLLASAIYLWWIRYNGQSITKLLPAIIGHEVHSGHELSLKAYLKRFYSKAALLFLISLSHPIIPVLALIGFLFSPNNMVLLLLYLGAVAVSYVIQAARVWYYTVPFLPVIALLATFGIEVLLRQGRLGTVTCFVLLLLWIFVHGWRPYRINLEQLNRWTWLPHGSMPARNLALDQAAVELRSMIRQDSLLVFGHYNQAYALVETSYPTSIIAPNAWLNLMHPNWEQDFYQRLATEPPKFILDSDLSFDSVAAKEKAGLNYKLMREFPGEFKLFGLHGIYPAISRVVTRQDTFPAPQ